MFKEEIIAAFKERMHHCASQLLANKQNAVADNTVGIPTHYYLDNKPGCHFSNITFDAMVEAIKLIETDKMDQLNATMWLQILKAVRKTDNQAIFEVAVENMLYTMPYCAEVNLTTNWAQAILNHDIKF